jgi:hypothetical protein
MHAVDDPAQSARRRLDVTRANGKEAITSSSSNYTEVNTFTWISDPLRSGRPMKWSVEAEDPAV